MDLRREQALINGLGLHLDAFLRGEGTHHHRVYVVAATTPDTGG